jgi:hypothetical protein
LVGAATTEVARAARAVMKAAFILRVIEEKERGK